MTQEEYRKLIDSDRKAFDEMMETVNRQRHLSLAQKWLIVSGMSNALSAEAIAKKYNYTQLADMLVAKGVFEA